MLAVWQQWQLTECVYIGIMYVFHYIKYIEPFLLLLDQVTDLDFSPFDDYLLATCSADETVLSVLISFLINRFINIYKH